MTDTVTTTIKECARCGGEHKVICRKFANSPIVRGYDYWTTCPTTGEPIIVMTIEVNDAPKATPL